MNIRIDMITRLFRSVQSDGEIMHPHRDWKRLLLVTLIAAFLLAGWGVYMFWQIGIGELVRGTATSSERAVSIDRGLLAETLTHYEEKKVEFEALERGEDIPANPAR